MIAGRLADQFPLPGWQAASGCDTDANVNQVLANRASQLLGGAPGSREPVDPTRDVAMGQVPGSAFGAATSIASVIEIEMALVPRCLGLTRAIERRPGQSPGQARRLRAAVGRLVEAEGGMHEIRAGLNEDGLTTQDLQVVVTFIAAATGLPFIAASDGRSDCDVLDAVVAAMAAARGLVIVLLNTAGDYPPRDGQAEAVTAACRHTLGRDQIVVAAAAQDSTTRLMARPLIITSVLDAIQSLGEGCQLMRRIISSSDKRNRRQQ